MVRRLAIRATGRGGSPENAPKRNRAWLFVWITLGAGALSAVAALLGGWLTELSNLTATNPPPAQIEARALFPPVPAVHKVVDVYDPPPPAAQPKPAPKPPAAAPTPTPRASPSPIHSTPSPTPPDD